MSFMLNIGHCTLVGNYRENNEDAIAVKRLGAATLCLVADGMGGQNAGEVASRRAVDIVGRELRAAVLQQVPPELALQRAIVRANQEILTLSQLDRKLHRMGTTIVVGVWGSTGELHLAHVGDSRAYLIRAGRIKQLTDDHSLVQTLLKAGALTEEEHRNFGRRNVLAYFLGNPEINERGPDIQCVRVKPGDRYLLCTDGLTNAVADDDLLRCIQETKAAQSCAEALGQLALACGSRDNVSCIVVEVVDRSC